MHRLFIYYSNTGNMDEVASYLEKLGYEVRKVIRKKKMPKSTFPSMMVGGFLASIKHKDKLTAFNPDISAYKEVVIGSPIWNKRFASPMNTVLSELDLKGKKLSFIFSSGSGTAKKAVKRVNKLYPDATIYILKEPKKYIEELSKLASL